MECGRYVNEKIAGKKFCYREQLSIKVSYSTLMRKLFFLMTATSISLT